MSHPIHHQSARNIPAKTVSELPQLAPHSLICFHPRAARSDRVFALIFLAAPRKNANKLTSAGRWCCRSSSMLRGARCSVAVLISWRRPLWFHRKRVSYVADIWLCACWVCVVDLMLTGVVGYVKLCCDNDLEYADLREDLKKRAFVFFFLQRFFFICINGCIDGDCC